MAEKPILFSGEMVGDILDGTKTQTRRVIKPQPLYMREDIWLWEGKEYSERELRGWLSLAAPHQVGDRLWVRETFVLEAVTDVGDLPTDGRPHEDIYGEDYDWLVPHYRATEPEPHIVPDGLEDSYDDRTRWSPSIFMPKWATRIWLEVTGIRAERVQDITATGIMEEGVKGWKAPMLLARSRFQALWDSINAERGFGWDTNCWAWVYEFKRLEASEGASR